MLPAQSTARELTVCTPGATLLQRRDQIFQAYSACSTCATAPPSVGNSAGPWPPVHAAALVRLGEPEEARRILADTLARHPGYDASRIAQRLDYPHPEFVAGRDGLIASLRKIGLP